MKDTAVIILNWNGAWLMRDYLPTVVANTPTADIWVADNASSDESMEVLRRDFPMVQPMVFDHNYGFAEGYNRAIREVGDGYKYVVLLNSDVATHQEWLPALHDFMESNPQVAACQPAIRSLRHEGEFEYAGAAGGFLDKHGYPYCRGRIFGTIESDNGQYDNNLRVDWASGACLMVRRSDYLDAGGMDPTFFAHMEEIDLCWRLRARGKEIWAVPQAKVWHLGGASLPQGDPRKTYLNFRNNLVMMRKNLPRPGRSAALIIRRLLDSLAFLKYLVSLDLHNAIAIIKAHRDYARMARALPEPDYPQPLSPRIDILQEYYLRGHRHFSQLPCLPKKITRSLDKR